MTGAAGARRRASIPLKDVPVPERTSQIEREPPKAGSTSSSRREAPYYICSAPVLFILILVSALATWRAFPWETWLPHREPADGSKHHDHEAWGYFSTPNFIRHGTQERSP